jgi:hypothetical protein
MAARLRWRIQHVQPPAARFAKVMTPRGVTLANARIQGAFYQTLRSRR